MKKSFVQVEPLDHLLEVDDVAVGQLARRDALALGDLGHRLAVLVGAGQEEDLLAALAHVARDDVGGDRRVGVAEMRLGVDVVDRRRDVEAHEAADYRSRRGRAQVASEILRPRMDSVRATAERPWLGTYSRAAAHHERISLGPVTERRSPIPHLRNALRAVRRRHLARRVRAARVRLPPPLRPSARAQALSVPDGRRRRLRHRQLGHDAALELRGCSSTARSAPSPARPTPCRRPGSPSRSARVAAVPVEGAADRACSRTPSTATGST